jgi:Collagenase and related proteases
MNKFKLGTNFDKKLIYEIIEINKQSKNKVAELYGSIRKHAQLAARPDFRLPDISMYDLQNYVELCNSNGIDFNYTLNSIMPYGSKKNLDANIVEVVELILWLSDIGVKRVTVANPLLLEIIRNIVKSNIGIELSTILHIDTVTQIKYLHEKYNLDKVCANLNKNRDFVFIKKAAEYCKTKGIEYELMVNEFCGVGTKDCATHCVYRDSCYMCHATNKTLDDDMLFDNYPMNICTSSRNENPSNWLKLRFIRPEDIKIYNELGVTHFKVTGRTATTKYILRTIDAYLSENYEGNLIGLWKPLESIKGTQNEDFTPYEIDNKRLDGFLDKWLKADMSGNVFNCDYEVCGETCNYCEMYYKRKVLIDD